MRLTKKIREEVVQSVVDEKINKKVEAVRTTLTDLANDLVKEIYSSKERAFIASAKSGWLDEVSQAYLRVSEGHTFRHKMLETGRLGIHVMRPFRLVPAVKRLARDRHRAIYLAPKTASQKAILKNAKATLDVLQEKEKTLLSIITPAVLSCTTDKNLKENYPDLVKYLPKAKPVSKAMVVTAEEVAKVLQE